MLVVVMSDLSDEQKSLLCFSLSSLLAQKGDIPVPTVGIGLSEVVSTWPKCVRIIVVPPGSAQFPLDHPRLPVGTVSSYRHSGSVRQYRLVLCG